MTDIVYKPGTQFTSSRDQDVFYVTRKYISRSIGNFKLRGHSGLYLRCEHQNMAASILLVFIISFFVMRWPTEAQQRMGCFSFNHGNTVLSVKIKDPVGSIEACIQQCKTHRATTYAGVRYSYNCYCGDNHDHTVNGEQLNDRKCSTSCNDHTPRCGDRFSIVIYSVCDGGRYRNNTNCDASCHCKDDHICLYRNGSCPANCETGWSGVACNVRVVQPTTEDATPIFKTTNRVTVSPQTTALTDKGAEVTVSSGPSESTNNAVAATGPSKRVDDHKDGISVTAVAVGVSLAVLVLVVIIALIVYFRRRRKSHKSGDENDDGMKTSEVKTDYSTAKHTENGPTIYTPTESPEPCYSSVGYLSNCPDNNDIPKSDYDVAINGELEMVEYAVVKKPGDEKHLNLKENSLYGTNAGDSDDEGQE